MKHVMKDGGSMRKNVQAEIMKMTLSLKVKFPQSYFRNHQQEGPLNKPGSAQGFFF